MANEQILEQILENITDLNTKVTSIDTRLTSLDTKVASIDTRLTSLDTKVTSIDTRLTSIEDKVIGLDIKVTSIDDKLVTLQAKVIDIEYYMKENMVTREEFDEKIDELYTHVDGFATLQTRLEQEVVMLRSKYNRLEKAA